jgi:ABC-2 type transport system ATP-binding protein
LIINFIKSVLELLKLSVSNDNCLFNLQMLAAMNTKLTRTQLIETLDQVGLHDAIHKKVSRYSLGMRQRLGIAQAIMGDPELIILDEPFNGLDQIGVTEIRKLILQCKEAGKTILLSSHYAEDIELLCDTVHRMEAGVLQE